MEITYVHKKKITCFGGLKSQTEVLPQQLLEYRKIETSCLIRHLSNPVSFHYPRLASI